MPELLPNNSTKLEEDALEATNVRDRLLPCVEMVRAIKHRGVADDIVPFLIYEYGLGELLPYLRDPRRALDEGILWQRIRGTPAAMKLALSWLGLDNVELEQEPPGPKFAEYQVGFDGVPQQETIDALVAILGLSAPVRSRLVRVYNRALDFRPLILSGMHLLGPDDNEPAITIGLGLLSDFSGVLLDPGNPQAPKVSLGRVHTSEAMLEPEVRYSGHFLTAEEAPVDGVFRLSEHPMDDEGHLPNPTILRFLGDRLSRQEALYGTRMPHPPWPYEQEIEWGGYPFPGILSSYGRTVGDHLHQALAAGGAGSIGIRFVGGRASVGSGWVEYFRNGGVTGTLDWAVPADMLTTNTIARMSIVRFRTTNNSFRIHRNRGSVSWATYRAGLAADTSVVFVNETTQEWVVAAFPAQPVSGQISIGAQSATWFAGETMSAPFLGAAINGYDGIGNFGEALEGMFSRFENATVSVAILPVNTYRPSFG